MGKSFKKDVPWDVANNRYVDLVFLLKKVFKKFLKFQVQNLKLILHFKIFIKVEIRFTAFDNGLGIGLLCFIVTMREAVRDKKMLLQIQDTCSQIVAHTFCSFKIEHTNWVPVKGKMTLSANSL